MRKSTLQADVMLLLAAAIWGSGFVAQRLGMEHLGPFVFTAIRFAVGTLVLLPIIQFRGRRTGVQPDAQPRLNATLRTGVVLGAVLFGGAALQQIGLVTTSAAKGGFITGLYVVCVPLIGLFLGQRAPIMTWLATILAVVGLYLLSVKGTLQLESGDLFMLGGAVVWALHVVLVGHLSPRYDPIKLAAAQFTMTSVLACLAALVLERNTTWPAVVDAGGAILYSGVLSVGVAFTLQVVAQRQAPASHAAILLSLEAVFAALFGIVLLSETLSGRQVLGCALMLAAMLLAQLRRKPAQPPALQDGSIGPV
ncbi:MAG: DMT family transporter [Phycisphaerales bacterium JB038]